MPLRFLRKQSCWGSGSRDSGSSVSSIFEKVIMLGVWLSRFGGRCLFDFGASNLVGSVFSNSTLPRGTEVDTQGLSNYPTVSDVVGAASFTCSTLAENFGKVICEVFDRIPIISAKLSVRVTGADKAGKVGASSISEIGPRGASSMSEAPSSAAFYRAGIKFQSTLESPPVEAPFLHF
ncbi:hypothetical protein ACFX15_025582 [Malus domestica]